MDVDLAVLASRVGVCHGVTLGAQRARSRTQHWADQKQSATAVFCKIRCRGPGRTSRTQLALRDLQLLDGALAEAARWAGVAVSDLDTAPDRAPQGRPTPKGRPAR